MDTPQTHFDPVGGATATQHDFGSPKASDVPSDAALAGATMPCESAHANFCRIVKQQQSPAQHSSYVRHPHGRSWQGKVRDVSLRLAPVDGTGHPTMVKMWAHTIEQVKSTRIAERGE